MLTFLGPLFGLFSEANRSLNDFQSLTERLRSRNAMCNKKLRGFEMIGSQREGFPCYWWSWSSHVPSLIGNNVLFFLQNLFFSPASELSPISLTIISRIVSLPLGNLATLQTVYLRNTNQGIVLPIRLDLISKICWLRRPWIVATRFPLPYHCQRTQYTSSLSETTSILPACQ